MNGKDLLQGLQYIGDDLVEAGEFGRFPAVAREKTSHRPRRPWLVAAQILLALALVGCGAAYVLSLEKVRIDVGTAQRDYALVDGVYVKEPHEVNTTTLTLAGLKGENAYRACADFYAFKEEYTAQGEQMAQSGTLPEGFWENYADVMDAKAREIAQQHGLKPEGQLLAFRTARNLCDALGVERFARENPEISVNIGGGGCYDTGNFWLNLDLVFPEGKGYAVLNSPGTLRWNRKDCFSRDYRALTDSGDWVEKNYTTASGSQVLLLYSPTQETGFVICDRGEALMTLEFNANIEYLSEEGGVVSSELVRMTDRQLKLVADAVDFSIHPKTPTQADVEAQKAISREATQNGYTLTLKNVETDGYVLRVLLSLAAPEGTKLPTDGNLVFDQWNLRDGQGKTFDDGIFFTGKRDDGDGKSWTTDLLLTQNCVLSGTDEPFAAGTSWELYMRDFVYSDRSAETGAVRETLAEGEWLIPISFDGENGDYRELELVQKPITMKASTGWDETGKDVLESFPVTSVKLRRNCILLTADVGEKTYADFFWLGSTGTKAVLKDGTEVEVLNGDFTKPLDLDSVDYILFADGTKLPVPTP